MVSPDIYRPAEHWLSERMVARMAGVPLLGGAHDGAVTGSEIIRRMIGVAMQGYVRDTELWCIARLCNDFAWRLIRLARLKREFLSRSMMNCRA